MGFLQSLGRLFGGGAPDPDYYQNVFGLAKGEQATSIGVGTFVVETGTVERAILDVVGLQKLGMQVSVVVSDNDRVALGQIEGQPGRSFVLERGSARARSLGAGLGELAGPSGTLEPTEVVGLEANGQLFKIRVAASIAKNVIRALA